jgi:hypothetical protein
MIRLELIETLEKHDRRETSYLELSRQEQRFPRHRFDRIRTQIRPWLGPSAKRESVFQR